MRYAALFVVPFVLCAQSPESDQKVTQALISEIQQLRLAIERSTLLSARTQLAISQMQMQEAAVARLNSQLSEVKSQANRQSARLTQEIQDLESKLSSSTEPAARPTYEIQLKQDKLNLEEVNYREQQRSARESELAVQLQTAQNQITDSRGRIVDLEKALDAAIQQLIKQK